MKLDPRLRLCAQQQAESLPEANMAAVQSSNGGAVWVNL